MEDNTIQELLNTNEDLSYEDKIIHIKKGLSSLQLAALYFNKAGLHTTHDLLMEQVNEMVNELNNSKPDNKLNENKLKDLDYYNILKGILGANDE